MNYFCLIVCDILNSNDMLVVSQILHVGYPTCSLTVLVVANLLNALFFLFLMYFLLFVTSLADFGAVTMGWYCECC